MAHRPRKTGDPEERLRQCARDLSALLCSEASGRFKWNVAKDACWGVTERYGKYIGSPFWTDNALADLAANGTAGLPKRLRHEHVVPRSVVADLLIAIEDPTPGHVEQILRQYAFGCVVTKAEDMLLSDKLRQMMPPEWDDPSHAWHRDPWARYRKCNITWKGPLDWRGDEPHRRGEPSVGLAVSPITT